MNRPAQRFILRSLGATAIGWLAPTVIFYALPMNGTLVSGVTGIRFLDVAQAHVAGFIWFSVVMSCWVVPTWLLVVLPLALLVPHRSKFWHPLVIGPVGLVAGGSILVGSIAILTSGPGVLQIRSLLPMAVLASGVGLICGIALGILIPQRKKPNQTLEPTAMAVTPPAAQEPRQP